MASLQLGTIKSQKPATIELRGAIHPSHGLVWTDGRCVFRTPVDEHGIVNELPSGYQKLGEYRQVAFIGWGPLARDGCHDFLAVGEPDSVTVWRIDGGSSDLKFSLAKKLEFKIHGYYGFNWHPTLPVICCLSTSGATLHHMGNGQTLILQQGSSGLGVWSHDGQRLVLVNKRDIHVICWKDIRLEWTDYTFKEVQLDGYKGAPKSIALLSNEVVAIATELPLANVINQMKEDIFTTDIQGKQPNTTRPLITEIGELTDESNVGKCVTLEKNREGTPQEAQQLSSLTDALKEEIAKLDKGPIDLNAMLSVYSSKCLQKSLSKQYSDKEHILKPEDITPQSKQENSDTNYCHQLSEVLLENSLKKDNASLIFLEENAGKKLELKTNKCGWNAVTGGVKGVVPVFKQIDKGNIEDSAHIHLVDISCKYKITASIKVPGILSPSLLGFEAKTGHLILGGSGVGQLQLYHIANNALKPVQNPVDLSFQERPIGLCCSTGSDLVSVLVTKSSVSALNSALPLSPASEGIDLYLRQFHLSQMLNESR